MLDLSKYGDSEQGPLLSSGGGSGSIILDDAVPAPKTMIVGRNGIGSGLVDDGGLVVVPRRQVLLNNALGGASIIRQPSVLEVSPQARALTEEKVRQLFVVQD